MIILFLHGNGWDELVLLAGAIALAFLVVKLTSRGSEDAEQGQVAPADGESANPPPA